MRLVNESDCKFPCAGLPYICLRHRERISGFVATDECEQLDLAQHDRSFANNRGRYLLDVGLLVLNSSALDDAKLRGLSSSLRPCERKPLVHESACPAPLYCVPPSTATSGETGRLLPFPLWSAGLEAGSGWALHQRNPSDRQTKCDGFPIHIHVPFSQSFTAFMVCRSWSACIENPRSSRARGAWLASTA